MNVAMCHHGYFTPVPCPQCLAENDASPPDVEPATNSPVACDHRYIEADCATCDSIVNAGKNVDREARIRELEEWRPLLIEYTRKKIALEDWHGVADGAMDLRDLDGELDGLRY